MSYKHKEIEPTAFKLLKGTIIKVHGHPAQLKRSLEVTCVDGQYLVDNIDLINDENLIFEEDQ